LEQAHPVAAAMETAAAARPAPRRLPGVNYLEHPVAAAAEITAVERPPRMDCLEQANSVAAAMEIAAGD